jgi:NAD:arginine ADP-ribosyltransferase
MAKKTGFNVEDAEILLKYLKQFYEVLKHEWSEVKKQWSFLQSTWRDEQFDTYEPLHETLSSEYDEADKACHQYIVFLEEIIRITEGKNATLGELTPINNGSLQSNTVSARVSNSTARPRDSLGNALSTSKLDAAELAQMNSFFQGATGDFQYVTDYEKKWKSKFAEDQWTPPPPPPSALELGAVSAYTGNTYDLVNCFLRDCLEPSEKLKNRENVLNFTRLLNSALAQLPTYSGTAYRGVSKDLSEAQLARYIVGETVQENSFTSASTSKTKAFEYFGTGNTRFIILSKTSSHIKSFSNLPEEDEVLFAANSQFRVVDRRQEKGKTIILMEDVSNEL